MKHRSRACADFFRRWTVQTRANNAPLDHRDSTRRFFILVHLPSLRSFFLLPSDVSLLHPPFNCARVFSNTRLFVISSILGEFSERSRKRSGSSILWERKKRNRPSYRAPRFDPFEELMRREKCYFFSWFCCARGTAGVNEARELVFVPFFLSRGKIFFLSWN